MIKTKRFAGNLLISVLVAVIFLTQVFDADARQRRYYNPEKTKQEALELIRSSSEEVSQIAGLEPSLNDSLKNQYMNQTEAEELSTNEEIEGEAGEDIEELIAEDDVEVDIETFNMLWLAYVSEGEDEEFTESGFKKSELMETILDWLGTPYRFGGTTEKAIDCSAFVRAVFLETSNIMLPRTAREQIKVGNEIERDHLQFGDMIFFHTYNRQYASHVGIFLGDDLFAHASSRYGVTVSSLESTYYKKRFIGGRRISAMDINTLSIYKSNDLLTQ